MEWYNKIFFFIHLRFRVNVNKDIVISKFLTVEEQSRSGQLVNSSKAINSNSYLLCITVIARLWEIYQIVERCLMRHFDQDNLFVAVFQHSYTFS